MALTEGPPTPETNDVQQVPLPIGTPVSFQKVDPVTRENVAGSPLTGGFVHASVGKKAYIYDPRRDVISAPDIPGNLHYTGNTSALDRIEVRGGVYFLHTVSKSVYKVEVGSGAPVIYLPDAAEIKRLNAVLVPSPEAVKEGAEGTPAAVESTVAGEGWTVRGTIAWLLRRKKQ